LLHLAFNYRLAFAFRAIFSNWSCSCSCSNIESNCKSQCCNSCSASKHCINCLAMATKMPHGMAARLLAIAFPSQPSFSQPIRLLLWFSQLGHKPEPRVWQFVAGKVSPSCASRLILREMRQRSVENGCECLR